MRPSPAALALALLPACAADPPAAVDAPRPPRPAPSIVRDTGGADDADDVDDVVGARDASVDPDAPPPQVAGRAAVAAPALAGRVAGRTLELGDLLREWHAVAPREVFLVVEKLVATRLAMAEAQRLGIRLEPGEVEAAVEEEVGRAEEELVRRRPGRPLEELVLEEYDVDLATWRRRVRDATIRRMLVERAVRAHALEAGSREVRALVVRDRDHARALAAELAAGADFATLAREHSVDRSAEDGGRIPYVVLREGSTLARLAFDTPVGEVGGPVPAAEHWFLVRTEAIREPVEGAWPDLAGPVERSLVADPIAESEFLTWKLAMERRYPVDLRPLRALLAAPVGSEG